MSLEPNWRTTWAATASVVVVTVVMLIAWGKEGMSFLWFALAGSSVGSLAFIGVMEGVAWMINKLNQPKKNKP